MLSWPLVNHPIPPMHCVLALFLDELYILHSPNGPWWQILSILEAVSLTTRCQQKTFSSPWVSSSKKSVLFFGVRIKCKPMTFVFCRDLWFLFDLWFLRKLTSISSRVWRLIEFRFLNVCIVLYLSNDWKWLIFVCSVIAGCISLIVWKKSSISSNFSLLHQTSLGRLWSIGSSLIWVNLEVDQYVGQFVDRVLRRLKQLSLCDWQSHVRGEIMSRLLFL